MAYLSWQFYLFVIFLLLIYYILPLKIRWVVLFAGSIGFYFAVSPAAVPILAFSLLFGYLAGEVLFLLREFSGAEKNRETWLFAGRVFLSVYVLGSLSPLILIRVLGASNLYGVRNSLIVPVGLSFYSLQMIAYLADIWKGEILPQKDFRKFTLFMTYFPQIIQGPIPRYRTLAPALFKGHRFSEKLFVTGFYRILWGFFLKLMIADKVGICVDRIFSNPPRYVGGYVLVGGLCYSLQLYADFLACVTISRGVSMLFGVELGHNFAQPYRATSIGEFWRRWHISLSSWLRDYVYIPLGGSRKGTARRYINLFITFLVSGIWHGMGWNYVVWGCMHGVYQIAGKVTARNRTRLCLLLNIRGRFLTLLQTFFTFFWVMLAWIIFRADSLKTGIRMIRSLFTVWNPWIFFDNSLFGLGLGWKECMILLLAVLLMAAVGRQQAKGNQVTDWLYEQNTAVRFAVCIFLICVIWVFGTYGYGFESKDFIYGGF